MGYILMGLGTIFFLAITMVIPFVSLDLLKKNGYTLFTVPWSIAMNALAIGCWIVMVWIWIVSIETGCFAGCLSWEEPYL